MMIMIDPTNVRGAFTGGGIPSQQSPQDTSTAQPVVTSQPAPAVSNDDALSALEALVAESAQVTLSPTTATTPPTVQTQPSSVQSQSTDLPAIEQTPVSLIPQQPQSQQQQSTAPVDQSINQTPQQPVADPTAQAVIASMQTLPDSLNPPNPAPTSAKETFERPAAPDATSIDVGGAVQHVEVEKNPELPVEVEGFLQRVQDFSAQQPQEIVIADGTNEQATTNYPSRPVIVLPITEEEEKAGKKKSPRNSIRWLVEWSHKVIRMFAGKVIYRHVDQE